MLRLTIHALATLALVSGALTAPAAAQGGPPPARARVTVATLPFADGVIVVDALADHRVAIAGSHGDSALTIFLTPADARSWADSTAKLLARPVHRTARVLRSLVNERQSGAGLSFVRHDSAGKATYGLFFADRSYGGFPFTVTRRDATLLVRGVRKAAGMARERKGGK